MGATATCSRKFEVSVHGRGRPWAVALKTVPDVDAFVAELIARGRKDIKVSKDGTVPGSYETWRAARPSPRAKLLGLDDR